MLASRSRRIGVVAKLHAHLRGCQGVKPAYLDTRARREKLDNPTIDGTHWKKPSRLVGWQGFKSNRAKPPLIKALNSKRNRRETISASPKTNCEAAYHLARKRLNKATA